MSDISDLYKRISFTIFILVIYRFCSYIPIAGIDNLLLDSFVSQNQSGILGMVNTLSGGAMGRMSVFALGIIPYITSSIVIQLMTMCYDGFANLKKEGDHGRRELAQYSRYLTVILSLIHSYTILSAFLYASFEGKSIVVIDSLHFKFIGVITLVVGTVLLMWLAEQITSYGIGSGTSMIIFTGIVTNFPSSVVGAFEMARNGIISFWLISFCFLILIIIVGVIVFFEKAQLRIKIQYPKRQFANKIYSGDSSYMPLKINVSGVMPPISASTILLFPLSIINVLCSKDISYKVSLYLGHGKPLFILLYVILIIFFSFFYSVNIFNSDDAAENLRKSGAYIIGRRPGFLTSQYLESIVLKLTVIGSLYLSFICLVPEFLLSRLANTFIFGGTSILIVVNVVIDSFVQIQTYLFSSRYDKLMKKMKRIK